MCKNRTRKFCFPSFSVPATEPPTALFGREREYFNFADGLTEDVTMALAKIRHLRVIARDVTFRYKNKSSSVSQMGRELGARYVVEGSVRRSANRVRVTAQLIAGDSGIHLWTERFDRELADVFAVQDEIVRAISIQLDYSLIDAAVAIRRAAPAASLTAYDHFLRARSAFRRGAMIDAKNYLLEAVEVDPTCAAALANLAYFFAEDIYMQVSGEPVAELARFAEHYAARAIAANDGDPFVYRLVANAMVALGRHAEAMHQFESALSLNPFDTSATMNLGMAIGLAGRHEEGLAMIDRVFRLEPRLPPLNRANPFWVRCAMGDPESAKADLQKIDEPMANHHLALAICMAGAGREEEAQTHVKAFEVKRSPWFDVPGFTHWFCRVLVPTADRDRFLTGVRALGYKV
ncbi:adenylate cyclase [Mesorhizobium sp. LNHC220B00]|nr:adenylate cyclase [Mesorhizobium sp. LNHC220B00]